MKTLAFLLIANALLAQDAAKPLNQSAAALDTSSRSVMIIDPKSRASDFAQAFDFLRKDRPTQKIVIRTMTSELLNVTDVSPSSGGTLLMVKILSSQGVRTMIVPVEQITEIGYSP
ncbi:MAG: hypothetical protein K1X28_07490 [Parachlamydiales bacterium]|nr:hypothetical protein [Parachlamydiales bacterium]